MDYYLALFLSLFSIACLLMLIKHYNTVLFGFTAFSFFNIARATFSAFLFDQIFSLNQMRLTNALYWVIIYTAIGLICFVIGAWIAWQPLHKNNEIVRKISSLPWINPQLANVLMIAGIFTYILGPIVTRIPSLQSIWSSYQILPKISVLIALLYGLNTKHYRHTVVCFGLFFCLALSDIVLSGHIFSTAIFLIQVLFVLVFWKQVKLKSFILLVLGITLFGSVFVGWLDSRYIIRQGQLDNYSTLGRISHFSSDFQFTNPLQIAPLKMYSSIRMRLDLSDVLTRQAIYQPEIRSYEYGGTITSDILGALVPRILWPSKPALAGGSDFVSRYSGLTWKDTSMGVPYHFEFYANGGALAVWVGLFIIGWLTARLELYLITKNLNLPGLLGLFVILFGILGWEARIVLICISIIAGYIAMYLLGRILISINQDGWFLTQQESSRIYYQAKHNLSIPNA